MVEPANQATVYSAPDSTDPKEHYLHLLKLCLTGLAVPKPQTAVLRPGGEVEIRPLPPSAISVRVEGLEAWPADSFTMIGVKRLDNIRACLEQALDHDVPGDLIEAGVWRGGATIFMRALLKVHAVRDRIVFAADSYEGLPPPDAARYPADTGYEFDQVGFLSVPIAEVKQNFEKFGLLDDQVRFVEGLFGDALPSLADRKWSLIRLDGDLYESTITSLDHLYPNLSVGGFLIVDDYGLEPCRLAVDRYRSEHDIRDQIRQVDATCVFWQKTG